MAISFFDLVTAQRGVQTGIRSAPQPTSSRRVEAWVRQHVLGERLFKDALLRERKRADRVRLPFAVVLVRKGGGSSRACAWVRVQRALAGVKRDIDVVGWFERGTVVGMLLPQMSAAGALSVMHRVRRDILSRCGDGPVAGPSIGLYGYGDDTWPEGASLPSVDLLLDRVTNERRHPWRDAAKRSLDVLGSLVLLALLAPVFLAILIAVKVTSSGPALFRQVRIGRRGAPFTMLKFRTMRANASHKLHQDYVTWFIKSSGQQPRTGSEVFKLTNDPRVTPVGRLLRRTSLDELPQFWNVLRGEMSLVGPRPPLPFEVEQYEQWHRRRVLDAKPGVTGPWQVNGRSRTTFDDMVRLDLRYARTHSLWTDIRILAATPRAMVSGKGAC